MGGIRWRGAVVGALACIAGCSLLVGDDDETPADDDAGIDAGPPLPCGTAFVLQDDFQDGDHLPQWDIIHDPTVPEPNEAAGTLELAWTMDTNASDLAEYVSRNTYDLIDSAVTIELPSAQPNTNAIFEVRADHFPQKALRYGFRIQSDENVHVSFFDANNAEQPLASPAYDAIEHRYLRIRADQNSIYFEHGPTRDGDFTPLASDPIQPWLSFATVAVQARGTVDGESGDRIVYGAVNIDQPRAHWCPFSDFAEDFGNPGPLDPAWARNDLDNGCVAEVDTNGLLNISVPTGGCIVGRGEAHDLTGNAIKIDVSEWPLTIGRIRLSATDDLYLDITHDSTETVTASLAGPEGVLTRSGAIADLTWQIRHDPETDFIVIESRPDPGVPFAQLLSTARPAGFAIDALRLEFRIAGGGGVLSIEGIDGAPGP